jgi:hypothetical protein
MSLSEQTLKAQYDLGNYCRTGNLSDIPGINKKHVKHYRRLVFNVVKNTMMQAYPIAAQVLEKEAFTELIHVFFSNYKPNTPKIWQLPGEFYEYAIEADFSNKTGKKWLNDLLFFEWTEIEVHTMPDIQPPQYKKNGNILNDVLVVNPESRLIELDYPVHIMNVEECEKNKAKYYLLISRDPDTGHVNFFNLPLFHAWIYEKISIEQVNMIQLVPEIKSVFGFKEDKKILENTTRFISDLIRKKAIYGFRK